MKIIKDLNHWFIKFDLYRVNWGLHYSHTYNYLDKLESLQTKLSFTNSLAQYDMNFSTSNRLNWFYYSRTISANRVQWEWYKFLIFCRKLKKTSKYLLLYTDVFEDYPVVKHLGKQLNEAYCAGWYPGLNSNRLGLRLKRRWLERSCNINVLPSIIITFSTFYPISWNHFIKEFSKINIYYVSFVSFGDYYIKDAYLILTTKDFVNLYFYFFLIYRLLKINSEEKLIVNTRDLGIMSRLFKKKLKKINETQKLRFVVRKTQLQRATLRNWLHIDKWRVSWRIRYMRYVRRLKWGHFLAVFKALKKWKSRNEDIAEWGQLRINNFFAALRNWKIKRKKNRWIKSKGKKIDKKVKNQSQELTSRQNFMRQTMPVQKWREFTKWIKKLDRRRRLIKMQSKLRNNEARRYKRNRNFFKTKQAKP